MVNILVCAFMRRLYVPEIYRLQHAILSEAWNTTDRDESGQLEWPTIDELAIRLKKPKRKILIAVNFLQEKELTHWERQRDIVASRNKGQTALFKEELLNEGWEKAKTNLLRWVQIAGILAAIFFGYQKFKVESKSDSTLVQPKGKTQTTAALPKQTLIPTPYYKARPSPGQPVPDLPKKK